MVFILSNIANFGAYFLSIIVEKQAFMLRRHDDDYNSQRYGL